MASDQDPLTIERFSFSIRLNSLFFPLSMEEMISGFEKLGYEVEDDLRRSSGPGVRPTGSRMSVSGVIAVNDEQNLSIGIQSDRGVLSVHGRKIEDVLNGFREIRAWASDITGVEFGHDVKFYESIIEATLHVGKDNDPIETMKDMFSGNIKYQKFSAIFGNEISNFGVRLVNAGTAPSDDTWIDIRIDPSVERSSTSYRINGVVRGPDFEKQIAVAMALPENLNQIVAIMQESE